MARPSVAPGRLTPLIDQLHDSQEKSDDAQDHEARRDIAEADRKMARHRAVLEAPR